MSKNLVLLVVLVIIGLVASYLLMRPKAEPSVLNVYNWSDYISDDAVANFEKEYGIKVNYDVFDSNEVLEAKLFTGNTGFDIVVPSAAFMARQIQAGAFTEIDRSKLSNYNNLDGEKMKLLENFDPGNEYGVPYLWGTTGIGYNPEKVKAVLGEDAPVDSWELIFNPRYMEKLNECGVSILNAPSEIIPLALHFSGDDPNNFDPAAIEGITRDLLLQIRPYLTYIHSSQYINDLANGDICVAVGWSGDILLAADRAAEADAGVVVEYAIPKEGTGVWFDMLAIPKDARNVENAHLFIDYLLRPDVIAGISNYVYYANPNPASFDLIDTEVTGNPNIYPPNHVKLFSYKITTDEAEKSYTKAWRSFVGQTDAPEAP